MSKHNANLDVRGDLRVRGRVSEDLSMGLNKITNLGAPIDPNDAARLVDIAGGGGGGFYGITVGQSDDEAIFRGINTVKFETANFYITRNSNTDEVQVNFRGAGENVITFSDGVRAHSDDTLIFSSNDFYLTRSSQGTPVVNSIAGIGPRVIATKSVVQTLTAGAGLTTLTWDGEAQDVGGWHSGTVNTSRLTVPAGVRFVMLLAQISFVPATSFAAGTVAASRVMKNGVTLVPNISASDVQATAGSRTVLPSYPVSVVEGDYFEIQASIGGAVDADVTVSSYFAAWMV